MNSSPRSNDSITLLTDRLRGRLGYRAEVDVGYRAEVDVG